jgi:DNA-binding NarL/FixJ family response regulator
MDVRLSWEERAVLGLAARGLTNEEVAARLGLTRAAVGEAVARAMRALSGRTKLEAIVAAARLGLIEVPGQVCEPG